MKLTDELQNKIGNAKSEDEVKKILGETKQNVEEAGVILDDAELDQVAGGFVINIESSLEREVSVYPEIPDAPYVGTKQSSDKSLSLRVEDEHLTQSDNVKLGSFLPIITLESALIRDLYLAEICPVNKYF